MASAPQMINKRIELSISPDDIGKFIGQNAFALLRFVINKAKSTYSDDHADEGKFQPPRVSVVTPSKDKVFADCTAHCQELLDLLETNLMKHAAAVLTSKATKATKGAEVVKTAKAKPGKPKFCTLVFKSNMSGKQISKYIGAGGKNCKALAADLEEIVSAGSKTKDDNSFRVKISEPDIYDSRPTPKRFFEIKNGHTENDVFIFVTSKFQGDRHDLFLKIKKRMIESVKSLSEYEDYYNPDALSFDDVLGGGGGGEAVDESVTVSLDAFGRTVTVAEEESEDESDDDDDGGNSPGYVPGSEAIDQ
jgi:hypothetical protein